MTTAEPGVSRRRPKLGDNGQGRHGKPGEKLNTSATPGAIVAQSKLFEQRCRPHVIRLSRKRKRVKIYLAARYSRRLELCGYRDQLQAMGHEVTSRWLDGAHDDIEQEDFAPPHEKQQAAKEDVADLKKSDILIAFTEGNSVEGSSRGGRHVELGLALAWGKTVFIVGPRENLFCWLPRVQYEVFDDLLRATSRTCFYHDSHLFPKSRGRARAREQ